MEDRAEQLDEQTTDENPAESADNSFTLSEHLPYLLARTTGRVALAFSATTAELNLTLKMWRVLSVLAEFGELRLRDIAHLTAIDNSTLSRLVSSLHKRRLLARRRSLRNKREVVITLTPKGREHMEMLIPAAVEHFERMTAGIPASDIEITKATLTRIFENLDTLPDRQPALKESVLKAL